MSIFLLLKAIASASQGQPIRLALAASSNESSYILVKDVDHTSSLRSYLSSSVAAIYVD